MKNKPGSELFIADNGDSSMHRVDMKQYLNLPHGQRFTPRLVDEFNADEMRWREVAERLIRQMIDSASQGDANNSLEACR
jgi:hypothetical protein